jgi:sugar/nucleoside kinase (ribokinase family)
MVASYGNAFTDWIKRLREELPGVTISADTDKFRKYYDALWDISSDLDYLFGNEVELRGCTGADRLKDIRDVCLERGVRQAVVVKLGKMGAFIGTPKLAQSLPTYILGNGITSENGAGDVFCGATIHGLAKGDDPVAAVTYAPMPTVWPLCTYMENWM